jgi:flagellin-like hook-associated protein FlgL
VGNFSSLNKITCPASPIHSSKPKQLMTQSIGRISSGRQINSGACSAAGLMIANVAHKIFNLTKYRLPFQRGVTAFPQANMPSYAILTLMQSFGYSSSTGWT